jgi:hypothetical protein
VNSLQSVILTLSISYALIGALLLVVLVYARLPWPVKAVAVVVTSAFYIASFSGTRGLLGWASVDHLPATFKLLQARIVEPHSQAILARSIYGSRRSTRTIDQAASLGPTGFPIANSWRKGPTRPRPTSPPAVPKEGAPPISAPAKAA